MYDNKSKKLCMIIDDNINFNTKTYCLTKPNIIINDNYLLTLLLL